MGNTFEISQGIVLPEVERGITLCRGELLVLCLCAKSLCDSVLILKGSATEIISAVATAIVGVVFLGAACAGYVFRTLNWGKRGVLGLAGLLLLRTGVACGSLPTPRDFCSASP